jgi:uncharacterized protein YwgA
MADKSVIPWHQYAAISYVAEKAQGAHPLGKTAMQKLIYLIQELTGVPVGYRFRIYNYGPYSSDLAEDVTYVEFLNGIRVDFDAALNSYKIEVSEKAPFLKEKAREFIDRYQSGMDKIIQEFGQRKARELELVSTTVYVSRVLQATQTYSQERLMSQVQEIKPKFRPEEIQQAIKDLQGQKYVPA